MGSIVLYYCPKTRSIRPRWLLEELELPYELQRIDLSKGEHKQEEYMKIHPHGSVPALKDGDLVLFESAAICAYLADQYGKSKLAPAVEDPLRGLYYQWLFYSIGTMETPILNYFLHTQMLPEEQRRADEVQKAQTQIKSIVDVVAKALNGKKYILGDQFTAADVMIGSMFAWAKMMKMLAPNEVIDTYTQCLMARPAFQRAMAD